MVRMFDLFSSGNLVHVFQNIFASSVTVVARPLTSPSNLAKIVCMKRVKIGEFRDRASELIRRAAGGETVVILNRDREVAKIVPITAQTGRAGGLVGSLAGTAEVRGDIETPIAPVDAWFRKPS